jgi:protein-disulfide isomerase
MMGIINRFSLRTRSNQIAGALFMRPSLYLSFAAIALMSLGGCNKADPNASADKAGADTKTVSETSAPKASAETLKSLSPEQQVAVRAMIRDTLIENPEILLEAQRAFEAKQERVLNEKVAASFITLKRDHSELSFGPANAKVTIIEFFDYKCGFCHAANDWLWTVMETNKDVRVIFKELPVLSQNSHNAAKAAFAAQKQNKYKDFHRALMTARGDLGMDQVMQIATTVGLDIERLKKDMEDPKVEAHIAGVREQATQLGINGTPGFVINGKLITGFAKDQLDAALATAGIDAPVAKAAPSKG